jgi:hypothetical protein
MASDIWERPVNRGVHRLVAAFSCVGLAFSVSGSGSAIEREPIIAESLIFRVQL